jgi:hypothetical protein
MNGTAFLQAFSALHPSGIYATGREHLPWNPGQAGPLDVRRAQVFDQPFPTFGKLLAAEKLAFATAALIFADRKTADPGRTGICLGSRWGSFSTDLRFVESIASGFPRPAYFSATLPSSPVAEAAIQFGLKGPVRVVVGGGSPGLAALECALRILRQAKAAAMLVQVIHALEPRDAGSPLLPPGAVTQACAYGFLLTAGREPGEPNCRLSLAGGFDKNNSASVDGESYFYDLLTALAAREQSRTVGITSKGFTGSLTIEKEE